MNSAILEARRLSAGYPGRGVLEDVSLSFQAGRVYSIIGPNGCGKTTLMRALSRNLKPASGQILLHGRDIFQTNTRLVARHVAMLAQTSAAMSDVTVRTLAEYGRFAHKEWWRGGSREDTAIVDWALEKTGMTAYACRKLTALSGGERQRAWIAMSLAQKPELLLLDEPTTFLDISHQLEIMELISRLNREEGITIVMVLHDIGHAARYSDELIVLNDRRVYRQGGPWEVLTGDVLKTVFRVEADLRRDAETGVPLLCAKRVVG